MMKLSAGSAERPAIRGLHPALWAIAGLVLLGGAQGARAQTSPDTLQWGNPDGGLFETPTNWLTNTVPDEDDIAWFSYRDLSYSPYTISFNSDPTNVGLRVTGNVTLDLSSDSEQGHTYALTNSDTPSLSVNGISNANYPSAQLTIMGGNLSTVGAIIGLSKNAAVIVDGADATWTASGPVNIMQYGALSAIHGGTIHANDGLNLNAGGSLTIETGGTVSASTLMGQGDINLNGGTLRIATLDFTPGEGLFNFQKGTLAFTTDQVIGYGSVIGDLLDPSFTGTVSLGAGKTLAIDGTATIDKPVNLNGGTLAVNELVNAANLQFNSGTIQFNGDHTIDSASPAYTLLGGTITQGKTLAITGTATMTEPLYLDGGTLTVGYLNAPSDYSIFASPTASGTLNLTQGDLTFDSHGPLASPMALGTPLFQRHINVEHTVAVSLATPMRVAFGNSLSAGNLVLNPNGVGNLQLMAYYGGTIQANTLQSNGGLLVLGPGGTLNLTSGQVFSSETEAGRALVSAPGSIVLPIRVGSRIHVDGDVTLDMRTIVMGSTTSMPYLFDLDPGTLDIDGTLTLASNGLLFLRGGTLRTAGIIDNSGKAQPLLSGTLELTTDQTVDAGGILDRFANYGGTGLLSDKSLIIGGTATLNTPVVINGGTFSAGSIVHPENLTFNSGTLQFTTDQTIAAGGMIDNLAGLSSGGITAGKKLAVTGTATLAMPVAINGGTFAVGELVNPSNLTFNSGTLEFSSDRNLVTGGHVDQVITAVGGITTGRTLALTGADTLAGVLTINGGNLLVDAHNFTNTDQGVIEVTNGGSALLHARAFGAFPSIQASEQVVNEGIIQVTDSTLSLGKPQQVWTPYGNDYWTNRDGTIILNNSTLNLGGRFTTADIGTIQRTGGTINVTGLMDNSNATLTLDGSTGSWNLAGGIIQGGTILLEDGSQMILTDAGGTLNGVTLQGGVVIETHGNLAGSSTVAGDLTNAGTLIPRKTDDNDDPTTSLDSPSTGDTMQVMSMAFGVSAVSPPPDHQFHVSGNYTQADTGQLVVEFGTDFGQLVVGGGANLDGSLQISTLDGANLSQGTAYEILTAGSISGAFNRVLGANLENQTLSFDLDYTDTSVLLTLLQTGDISGDGSVGWDDLITVLSHWEETVTAGVWDLGDLSGDQWVGLNDLNALLFNWNDGPAPTTAQINAKLTELGKNADVPEPAGLMLLAMGGLALLCRRNRRC